MTSEDLEALFTPFGAVASAKIVTDKFNNNRSKGFGFVEMANDDEARTAISQLHDTEILGRNIVVNESTPRPEGERTFKKKPYGAGGGGGADRRAGRRGAARRQAPRRQRRARADRQGAYSPPVRRANLRAAAARARAMARHR